jgi:hypothetical protein
MKSVRLLFLLSLVFSLALGCNHKDTFAPWQWFEDGYTGPISFIDSAFLLLDDCTVESYPYTPEEMEAHRGVVPPTSTGFGGISFSSGNTIFSCAIPANLCGHFPVIDSKGTVVSGGYTSYGGCEDRSTYEPDGSHLPPGFAMQDTLYLVKYILNNWPDGRPATDHVIYTRVNAVGDTSRYAIPRLCGQYLLIDEDGLSTGRHYVGVGGCAGYQEMISK